MFEPKHIIHIAIAVAMLFIGYRVGGRILATTGLPPV